jgi:hypothetical protein
MIKETDLRDFGKFGEAVENARSLLLGARSPDGWGYVILAL